MRKCTLAAAGLLLCFALSACGQPAPTGASVSSATPAPATVKVIPTATSEPTRPPQVTFETAPCPFELPAGQVEGDTVDCGYLIVPEDRADPHSRNIRIAVAVFHLPRGSPEPNPIVYLEGGPGGSALEFIDLSFSGQFEPLFAAHRDIVVFDQRGVGFSTPTLDCPNLDELEIDLLDWEVDGKRVTSEEAVDLMVQATLACGEELDKVADLASYNTAASAADVNDLRLALGYDQVNLWGVSYGTRLALELMRTYPEGIRSVVLDSTYPPDVDLYAEAPANAARAFDLLFQDCAADEACHSAYPHLREVLFNTVAQLNAAPARFQSPDPFTGATYEVVLTGDDLLRVLFQLLYMTDIIPSLPLVIYDASEGDLELVRLIVGVLVAQDVAASTGMGTSVQCHDEFPFSSLEGYQAALTEAPELAGLFEVSTSGPAGFRICRGWGAGQAPPAEGQPVVSGLPALILSGQYDPITPPAWARRTAATLPNGYVFEYPGVGHGVGMAADCPRDMMIAFLLDPAVRPDDTCIAQMGPPQFAVRNR